MGVINKFMEFIGIGENNDSEADSYDDLNEDVSSSSQRSRRKYSDEEDYSYDSSSNVIPMSTGISSSKMVITQPNCYDDVEEIADYLKTKKSVIINLENISKEEARRVLDFMSGATFIAEGSIQKVSELIYLMTPKNVEIQNDADKTTYKQKMAFSWMK